MNLLLRIIRFAVPVLLLLAGQLSANNIAVNNIEIVERNDAEKWVMVQFDLSWDNSFRNGTGALENWDAAWVFLKWQRVGEETYGFTHGTLGASANHVIPAGFAGSQPADNLGIFVHRDATGAGTATLTGLQLRWDYGTDGLDLASNVNLKVFAIEMVYVPEGAFYVGSGSTPVSAVYEAGAFTTGPWTSGYTTPYQVTSEGAITIGNTAGNLWGISSSGNSTIGAAGTLPAAFPKGYAAFYCMKHEITQMAYVDFLNSLTRAQQNNLTNVNVSGTSVTNRYVLSNNTGVTNRNGVRCDATLPASPAVVEFYCDYDADGVKNEETDGQHIPCNWLSQSKVMAYLDWAALRPMTELEYEKAARGVAYPSINEYAWGSVLGATRATSIENPGTANETVLPADANMAWNNHAGVPGPLRAGFAATATSKRNQSGAGYWGCTELSGNLWEMAVSVAVHRTFDGSLGNGAISASGSHDVAGWPAFLSFRGGTWAVEANYSRISNRENASYTGTTATGDWGGRGVRQAPQLLATNAPTFIQYTKNNKYH